MSLFKKTAIGLDIADHTIEVAVVSQTLNQTKVEKLGRTLLAPGIVERGRIINPADLTLALKNLFKQSGLDPHEIIFGLPDSQIYTQVFHLSNPDHKEIEAAILNQAQNLIPLDFSDLAYAYKLLGTVNDNLEVLFVASSQTVMTEWRDFFNTLDIKVDLFSLESLAILRGLEIKTDFPLAIIDFGSATTNIFIYSQGNLRYTRTIKLAGYYLTQQIARKLKIKEAEAEALKIKSSLNGQGPEAAVIISVVNELIKESLEVFDYFSKISGQKVAGFILVGGSSQIPGLVEYCSGQIKLPAFLGRAMIAKKNVAPLEFIEAVGLALFGLESDKNNRLVLQPNLSSPIATYNQANNLFIVQPNSLKAEKNSEAEVEAVETKKDLLESGTEGEMVKSDKANPSQKFLLLKLLLILVVLLFGALYYRSYSRNQAQKNLLSQVVSYNQNQSFEFDVPLTVGISADDNTIGGRVFNNIVNSPVDYNSAMISSLNAAELDLRIGEKLFNKPLNGTSTIPELASSSEPLTFSWMIYSQKPLLDYVLKQIDALNVNKIPYALNSVEVYRIDKRGDNSFILKARVNAYVNELIRN